MAPLERFLHLLHVQALYCGSALASIIAVTLVAMLLWVALSLYQLLPEGLPIFELKPGVEVETFFSVVIASIATCILISFICYKLAGLVKDDPDFYNNW